MIKIPKGFACLSPERRKEIASMGGKASTSNFKHDHARAREMGRKGGAMSTGNFKNNPDRAREMGRRGGQRPR